MVALRAKSALVWWLELGGRSARLALRVGDMVDIFYPLHSKRLNLKYGASGFDPAGGAIIFGAGGSHHATALVAM